MISSSATTTNANDPLPYNLVTADNKFMLGIQLWGLDLNAPTRYFDVQLTSTTYKYGIVDKVDYFSLQPCLIEHWNGYPQVQAQYNQIDIDKWMCLPKDNSFQIKGKYASLQSKTLDITVRKCTNNAFESRPCAPQSEIDQFFTDYDGVIYYIVYFINPIINPDSQNYLDYYLQDSNYITFSQNGGEQSRIFVQDYQIRTDQSILPTNDFISETGGIITTNGVKSSYFTVVDTYARFNFFKSTSSFTYIRSFEKLDNVFSYIGGLFGIILIAFFSIVEYNSFKYQIALAGCLYRINEESKPQQKKYNFLNYLGQLVYSFLNLVRIKPNWQKYKHYQQMKQQINKQLDILFLLKRINFLQNSLNYLFTDHQLIGLHLANAMTLNQAIKLRRRYQVKKKLQQQITSKVIQNNQFQVRENATNENIMKQDQNFRTINSISITDEQAVKSYFREQNYSSQSSSQDQQQISILDAVKKIKKQQNENHLSKKIWRNIDKKLSILEPIVTNADKGRQIEEYQFEDINHYYSNAKQNNEIHQFVSPQIQQYQSQQNGERQDRNIFPKGVFSKFKAIHPQMQNQLQP